MRSLLLLLAAVVVSAAAEQFVRLEAPNGKRSKLYKVVPIRGGVAPDGRQVRFQPNGEDDDDEMERSDDDDGRPDNLWRVLYNYMAQDFLPKFADRSISALTGLPPISDRKQLNEYMTALKKSSSRSSGKKATTDQRNKRKQLTDADDDENEAAERRKPSFTEEDLARGQASLNRLRHLLKSYLQ